MIILNQPYLTEKSSGKEKNLCYTFLVYINSNKKEIKEEINKMFGVSVRKICTMIYPRKNKSRYTKKGYLYGRTSKVKKAIVKLEVDQKISFFKKKKEDIDISKK
ncbi:50S ribosomal protein L23 [Blattabacterium cuenoti]|uniref:50S ribosomal protein L23 n=1 Tax=Blattabacterium cuenoti TaxID=1653831 RepID=UPI001EE9C2B2|nr:50S ribosomal protein L23 [Blattabacterium cuenoti]